MSSQLSPYINFDGDTKQAMEFYRSVLGGELRMSTYGEFGAGEGPHADKIMHAMLTTAKGFVLMAADMPPGEELKRGNNFSVALTGDSADGEELRGYFAKLSEGGNVSVPLEKQMWGDEFGMCTDRFGVTWMVDISTQ